MKVLSFILLAIFGIGVTLADEGGRIVRSIRIEGNEKTTDRVILRELLTQVGDSVSETKLRRDRDRVYSLRLFNKVDIRTEGSTDSADVIIAVVERWYVFPYPIVGFKQRDTDKLFYGGGLMHSNLSGMNDHLSFALIFGYDRSAMLNYALPQLWNHENTFLAGGIGTQRIHNLGIADAEYEQEHSFGSFLLGRRFGLYRSVSGTIAFDHWHVSDTAQGRTVSPSGLDEFVSLGINYTYDSRNIWEYATEGMMFHWSLLQSGFGSSDVQLFTHTTDLRFYLPIGQGATIAMRGFGSFTSGSPVPAYRHVFIGFNTRLRGYFSEKLEGEDMAAAAAELRLPILSPRFTVLDWIPWKQINTIRYGLYAAAFVDAGAIWYRHQPIRQVPVRSSAGIGLHWLLMYSFVLRTEYAFNNLGTHGPVIEIGTSF